MNSDQTPLPRPDLSHLPRMGGLPFLGKTIGFLRDPNRVYRDGVAQHGSVFRITVLGSDWVVLAGPDALEHVYLNKDGAFSAREGLRAFAPYFAGSLLHRDGDDHRTHRRVMQSAFRSSAMQGYLDAMNGAIATELPIWPSDQRTKIAPLVKRLTLGMAAEVFMGLRNPDEIKRMNRLFLTQVAGTTAPIRAPLPFTAMRRGLDAKAAILATLAGLIESRRKGGGRDLFSEICRSAETEWQPDEITNHFNFLLVAAHDATTTALLTMLWATAKDATLQMRIQAEVDALPPGPLDLTGAASLDLIDCTYREALRLMAPSAFTARAVVQDTTWQGRQLPKGTRVAICPGPVMLSADLWTDPTGFDPDRFGPGREEHRSHPFAWSPFGGGAHKCIGMHFAGLQVKAIMVEIFRRWTVEMAPADDPVWKPLPTPTPKNRLPLTFKRR